MHECTRRAWRPRSPNVAAILVDQEWGDHFGSRQEFASLLTVACYNRWPVRSLGSWRQIVPIKNLFYQITAARLAKNRAFSCISLHQPHWRAENEGGLVTVLHDLT